jgi:uncharacterized protein YdiU (UPF0061 family)
MKSKTFYALMLVLAIFANTLKAETPSSNPKLENTEVKVSSFSKVLTVDMTNVENEKVTLTIQDATGNEVFNETLDVKNALRRKYNLKFLEKGNYELIIRKRNAKLTQAFEVDLTNINIKNAISEEKMYKGVNQKKELMDVNVLLEKEALIYITLKDNHGKVVFEESFTSAHLMKRYNLKLLPKGKYEVDVAIGSEESEMWIIQL